MPLTAGARKAAAVRASEVRLTDLDETRRLAYAALLARASGERALFDATLVNALAHHGLEVDSGEVTDTSRVSTRNLRPREQLNFRSFLVSPGGC
jgi:hypothetical protein